MVIEVAVIKRLGAATEIDASSCFNQTVKILILHLKL